MSNFGKVFFGGFIEVITGPMFSGKTEELIRRLRRITIGGLKVIVFKFSEDKRYDEGDQISSHSGSHFVAIPVKDVSQMRVILDSQDLPDVVAIDEVQFFNLKLVDLCQELADQGVRVIVVGLDMDFRGEPFGPMPRLLAVAEEVEKLNAVCVVCHGPATRTQRIVDGSPAYYEDRVFLVGACECYQARCRRCHQVPHRQD